MRLNKLVDMVYSYNECISVGYVNAISEYSMKLSKMINKYEKKYNVIISTFTVNHMIDCINIVFDDNSMKTIPIYEQMRF